MAAADTAVRLPTDTTFAHAAAVQQEMALVFCWPLLVQSSSGTAVLRCRCRAGRSAREPLAP
eukprot:4839435-Prymnesium_polylepis.1